MRTRAFTLVELLAYVGILTVVLGIIFFFIANIIINERSIGERVRVMDEADFAMRQVLDQARGAKNIDMSTDFAAVGGSDDLILNKTSSVVSVYVSSGALVMTDTASPGIVRTLTSPRVTVTQFDLICVGDPSTACASPATTNPKGVQIRLSLQDVSTSQTLSVVTSAVPRGY
jgi:type II secretory pathway component PulJ